MSHPEKEPEVDVHDDRPRWWRAPWVRVIVGTTGTVVGVGVALLTVALGHCSAFAGRCPADPQPLLEDDVFGGVAFGVYLAFTSLAVALRPHRKAILVGVLGGVPIALAAGLIARQWAAG